MRGFVVTAIAILGVVAFDASASANVLTLRREGRDSNTGTSYSQLYQVDFSRRTVVALPGALYSEGGGPYAAQITDLAIQWREKPESDQPTDRKIDRTDGLLEQRLPNWPKFELGSWFGGWTCRPAKPAF
jgi:hypothetical protein